LIPVLVAQALAAPEDVPIYAWVGSGLTVATPILLLVSTSDADEVKAMYAADPARARTDPGWKRMLERRQRTAKVWAAVGVGAGLVGPPLLIYGGLDGTAGTWTSAADGAGVAYWPGLVAGGHEVVTLALLGATYASRKKHPDASDTLGGVALLTWHGAVSFGIAQLVLVAAGPHEGCAGDLCTPPLVGWTGSF